MVTYIWKKIPGYYAKYKEEFKEGQWVGKIGNTYQDFVDGKWVKLSDEQLAFRDAHPDASIKEVIEMHLTERTLEQAKQEKLELIKEYDNSDNVNSLNINLGNGNIIQTWFTPDKRADYKASIDAAELLGMENVSPVFNGIAVTIPVTTAKMALAQILIYANRCYNVTESHKAAVNALNSIESVDSYDYTSNYPEKLTFALES